MTHLLIIPDGNRRYAKKNGLDYPAAYKIASDKVLEMIKWAGRNGFSEVTFYGLSYDNVVKREKEEVEPIVKAWADGFLSWANDEELKAAGIAVEIAGEMGCLPEYFHAAKDIVEKGTSGDKTARILIGYSGKADAASGRPYVETPIDIIIRPGGEKRLSDCPLLPAAYAELFFVDKLFPELEAADLDRVLDEFRDRTRNFGK